ncbi:prolipoprotein diacylglyceryl transferase [Parachryseolinea silvisoli]|uniref:prolipoprotein diacylglyceryl transferase n=1 Tax=Parachryseolinea silvisoli TaxID=2873601 RepID=UPI002265A92E|nr:prolipoprotein diacylglyceryl transferase [Parachryseolinea silvisoli]MCD9017899.1 prolipoprotein diacylglyceryl transferase [Parachryseolinea silvisoli]
MIPYITWNIDPVIFTIPGTHWPLRWYGLMWVLGFVISQQVMYYIFQRENRPRKDVDTLTMYILISTVLGARLGHFLFYEPSRFLTDPLDILMPPYSGLASHGAAIGILIGLWLFCRKLKYNYLWMVDRLVIVVCITGAGIRLGNLINSEMIGLPTDLPWAFIFTRIDNIPRHPAQLYEALYCIALFFVLFYLWKTRAARLGNGFIFGLFLIVLWTLRFIDEFFKVNQVAFEDHQLLNMGQVLSIPFILVGIFLLFWSSKQMKQSKAATPY